MDVVVGTRSRAEGGVGEDRVGGGVGGEGVVGRHDAVRCGGGCGCEEVCG